MNHTENRPEPPSAAKEARIYVAQLRAALLSPDPEAILACVPGLAIAAEHMRTVESNLREQPSVSIDDLRELNALKSDLRAVAKLIDHGARFYRGWARILGSAAAGYTASGEAVPLVPSGTVAIKG